LAHGEAIDEKSLGLLDAALAGEYVVINQVERIPSRRRIKGASKRIWRALLLYTEPLDTNRLDLELREGPNWKQVRRLALSDPLKSLLDRQGEEQTLGELLRDANPEPGDILTELAGLLDLEIIALRPPGQPDAQERPGIVQLPDDFDAATIMVSRSASLRRRARGSVSTSRRTPIKRNQTDLGRRLRILGKMDPWRSLGLHRTANEKQILFAADKLRTRFSGAPGDSAEVAVLLGRIQDEVARIADLLVEEVQAAEAPAPTIEDPRLQNARSLLDRGGATAAAAFLAPALQDFPDSAAHHTWYGRAVFLCPSRPLDERVSLALKHLEMAHKLGDLPAEHAGFLAEARAACEPDI
jgi:hypothetical protein